MKPDNTAVRTALWRALHTQIDSFPYVLKDKIGIQLIAPETGWQERPDMDPGFTKRLRAAIVGRARLMEDIAIEQFNHGIRQYIILGAGLDTFAQRHPELSADLQIFEIDQLETLEWKKSRLIELGYGVPEFLHFVNVNFETDSWWEKLLKAGFNVNEPAFVACTGVTLYLSKDAILDTLVQLNKLAPESTVAISFYLKLNFLDEIDKPLLEISAKGAEAAGTPFKSLVSPEEVIELAQMAGFKDPKTISTAELTKRYFVDRADGLQPATGEEFLIVKTR